MNSPATRGELMRRLGVQLNADRVPLRGDDGSYGMPGCAVCGATRLRVEWEDTKGFAGVIRHQLDDGMSVGCDLNIVADVLPTLPGDNGQPAAAFVEPAPAVKSAPKALELGHSFTFVQFIHPVSLTHGANSRSEMSFWSRNQHGASVKLAVDGAWITLQVGKDRRLVPMSNVAYIAERE